MRADFSLVPTMNFIMAASYHHFQISSPEKIQVLLILFTFGLLAIPIWFLSKRKNKTLPPGPRRLPLIGNLHQIGGLPHKSLHSLSRKYGPIMFLKLGSIPTVVISSADITQEIFKNHDIAFSNRPTFYAAKKLSYNLSDVTFAPYGKYWRDIRKIVMLELLSATRVQSFQDVRNEEVRQVLDAISCSSGPVNLSELMLSMANNVISRVAFGTKYDGAKSISDMSRPWNESLRETQSLLAGFCVADFFPRMGWFHKFDGLETRLQQTFKELDTLYNNVLEEHLARERSPDKHEDLVDVLLRIQKDSTEETPLSNEQIKSVLTDMFIAGTDTSSATLTWTMAELIRNPSAMKKAQDEVREVAKGKENVDETDLSKLVYLKVVIKETMRLHTPAPLLVPRETSESCTINGYNIPANTRVFINARSISTDPKYWEYPLEYRPERFLDSCIDFIGQSFEFIPFGVGRRICPGISFATVVLELTLANLLFHFDWKMPDGAKAEDLDMEEALGLTVHKKIPLCLVAIPVHV